MKLNDLVVRFLCTGKTRWELVLSSSSVYEQSILYAGFDASVGTLKEYLGLSPSLLAFPLASPLASLEKSLELDLIICADFTPKEKIVRRRYLVAFKMI